MFNVRTIVRTIMYCTHATTVVFPVTTSTRKKKKKKRHHKSHQVILGEVLLQLANLIV